ncbi:MAG: hypothetical protein J6W52_02965 [Bacteroidaceae bacterium]|nr:hypothetical protein [Bacteroidaceae bacterium]
MSRGFKTILLLQVILTLCACRGNRQDRKTIRQAEQLMQEQPDSALRVLQTIDRHSLRGETLARYALIYSIAQDKSGLDVTSDSLLRIAYNYYSRHPEDSLYARSQYYMGLYYSMVDSTKLAEDCLRTAIRYARERKEYYTQYLALNRLSHEVKYADAHRALGYSRQALDIYSGKCSPNVNNQIIMMQDISKAYILCNKEDSALYYLDMALEKAATLNDSNIIGMIMQDMSLVYSKQKDYRQALWYAKEAWRVSPAKSINLAACLANHYADADSVSQARELYGAIVKTGDDKHKYLAYRDLSALAAKEHNEPLSRLYSDSAYDCMDAIYTQQLRAKANYYNDIIQLEEEKLQQEKVILHKKLINWFLVMLFIVAVIISFFIYYNIRYRAKHRLEAERERHLLQEKFAREQHERESAYKDSQISMMRNLIRERYLFRKKIEEQKKNGRHITIPPEDWDEIQDFLEATSDNFVTRITDSYPNLREKDYQFCMLVRLGFSQKDLANIYSIEESSIKQKMVYYKKRFNVTAECLSFRQFISNY